MKANSDLKKQLSALGLKLYIDSGCAKVIEQALAMDVFDGVTTNPSLLHKAGQKNYSTFLKEVSASVKNMPVSVGVLSDKADEVLSEAKTIAAWSDNIFVKVPIVNCGGESNQALIHALIECGVKVNVTCLMSNDQIKQAAEILPIDTQAYLSIFAGRIADTGVDPKTHVEQAKLLTHDHPNVKVLWASTREIFNIFEAASVNCDVITVGDDIIKKLHLIGRDLCDFSKETVNMFCRDARTAGYKISL